MIKKNSKNNKPNKNIENERRVIFDVLKEVLVEERYSNLVLRNINSSEHSFISEMVYGVLERKNTLYYVIKNYSKLAFNKIHDNVKILLAMGIYQLLYSNVKEHAAIYETVQLSKELCHQGSVKFINGVLREVQRNKSELLKKIDNAQLDIKYSINTEFIELLKEDFSHDEIEEILSSFLKKKKTHIFVRRNMDEIIKKLEENNIDYIKNDNFIILSGSINVLTEFYNNGDISFLDISTYELNSLLPKDVDNILEMCASPGGKTTILSNAYEGKKITSIEKNLKRFEVLRKNVERLGIKNIKLVKADASKYKSDEKYDLVTLDVPCSGSGVAGKRIELKYKIDKSTIHELNEKQEKLLENAINLSNKYIIYSTCSIFNRENRAIIDKFQDKIKLIEEKLIKPKDDREGFYVALLKKR